MTGAWPAAAAQVAAIAALRQAERARQAARVGQAVARSESEGAARSVQGLVPLAAWRELAAPTGLLPRPLPVPLPVALPMCQCRSMEPHRAAPVISLA